MLTLKNLPFLFFVIFHTINFRLLFWQTFVFQLEFHVVRRRDSCDEDEIMSCTSWHDKFKNANIKLYLKSQKKIFFIKKCICIYYKEAILSCFLFFFVQSQDVEKN